VGLTPTFSISSEPGTIAAATNQKAAELYRLEQLPFARAVERDRDSNTVGFRINTPWCTGKRRSVGYCVCPLPSAPLECRTWTWAEAMEGSESVAGFVHELATTWRPNLGNPFVQRVDDTRHGRARKELSPVTTNKRPGWKLTVPASAAK